MLDKATDTPYNKSTSWDDRQSDEALCLALRQGDPEAEEALVTRYARMVRAVARPLFLAGGDNEDLVQEGMIGLIAAIRRYEPDRDASFASFAAHCVRNRLIEAVRRAARQKHSLLTHSVPLEALSFPSDPADPENLLLSQENQKELFFRLGGLLSRLELEILRLYLEGLSYREISLRLGKEPKSVDNAIQRVRRKLSAQHFWRSQS